MCGIVGVLEFTRQDPDLLSRIINLMTEALRHRGPDSQGVWIDPSIGIALGHRRLAIQDLSERGRQPMESVCKRYTMVFNGEIYNHRELRSELGSYAWQGESDSETLLVSISRFGFEQTLKSVVGMFAIAIWDRLNQELFLCRDRMGEKPIYYGFLKGSVFAFASELKALTLHPSWSGEIDNQALDTYLRLDYVKGPRSIYRGIQKLQAGHYLKLNNKGSCSIHQYWNIQEVAIRAGNGSELKNLSDESLIVHLETLLNKAIKGQQISDVPLGAFLSGGLDSSTVVALMQKQLGSKLKTFSIGFDDKNFNESNYAIQVAKHIGTEHENFILNPQRAISIIQDLPRIYDEPFADVSQIPTVFLCRMTRERVTVALTGDGGDEVFCGYNRYLLTERLWKIIKNLPCNIRVPIGILFSDCFAKIAKAAATNFITPFGVGIPINRFFDRGSRTLSKICATKSDHDLYRILMSNWADHERIFIPENSVDVTNISEQLNYSIEPLANSLSLMDQIGYLPDDILVKVDRAAMSVGLETRIPFLDHRVVEFAWKIDFNKKCRQTTQKWIVKELAKKHLPAQIIHRPKKGFSVPIASWLRGPLKEWSDSQLSTQSLQIIPNIDIGLIQRKWQEHQKSERNWERILWPILMLTSWVEHNRTSSRKL